MKTNELEEIVKEIKERENFLNYLKGGNKLVIAHKGLSELYSILTLSKEDLDIFKKACLLRIKELKELIKAEI